MYTVRIDVILTTTNAIVVNVDTTTETTYVFENSQLQLRWRQLGTENVVSSSLFNRDNPPSQTITGLNQGELYEISVVEVNTVNSNQFHVQDQIIRGPCKFSLVISCVFISYCPWVQCTLDEFF